MGPLYQGEGVGAGQITVSKVLALHSEFGSPVATQKACSSVGLWQADPWCSLASQPGGINEHQVQ